MSATTLARCEPGDHVCWTFDDDDVSLDATAAIIRAGVRDGHQIAYFTSAMAPSVIVAGLFARGIDVGTVLGSGQFVLATAEDTYLADDRFDVEATIGCWADMCEKARAAGFAGLRAIGDMSWGARDDRTLLDLVRYEAEVNRVYADGFAMAACQYDTRRFTRDQLDSVKAAHPAWAGAGAAGTTETPMLRIHRPDAVHLRLVGEADLTNQSAVRAMLALLRDEAVRLRQPARIDVTGLRFADDATVEAFLDVAAAVPAGLSIVGCRPVLARVLALHGGTTVVGLHVTVAG